MPNHLLTTPTILASSTLVLWNALQAHGYDANDIFIRAGLDQATLKDQDARFSAKSITRLHELTIEITGDSCFMLRLARFWHPSHLHALGYGWLASASLLDAFKRLIRYYDIASISMEQVGLERNDEGYLFAINMPDDMHPLHETEDESLMVLLVAMCRMSAGDSFKPLRVRLRRSRPSCASDFDAYFGTPVEFSSDELSLLLPAAETEAELSTANTTMARACDHIIDEYLARLDHTHVVNRVRAHLVESMPSGRVRENDTAQSLNMSVRSLQRKLKQEDTTFKDVLDETRRELSLSYIKDKHTSIKEITYLLGYSDPANFSRAFKRWTGMSPSAGHKASG
jgi:AraC-like DNA-binding protein